MGDQLSLWPDPIRWTWHGKPTRVWLLGEHMDEASLRDPYDHILAFAKRGRDDRRRTTWSAWHAGDGRALAEGVRTLDEVQRIVERQLGP